MCCIFRLRDVPLKGHDSFSHGVVYYSVNAVVTQVRVPAGLDEGFFTF